jgi:cardiolipin synthase
MDYAFGAAVLVAGGLAAGHAIVYKRDPRSAVLWLLAILLLPALGPVLYALFGVNRVQRRALRMRRYRQRARTALESNEKPQGTELASLARLVGEVSRRPLLPGNTIDPLLDGAETYPAMLEAIDGARASIALCSGSGPSVSTRSGISAVGGSRTCLATKEIARFWAIRAMKVLSEASAR